MAVHPPKLERPATHEVINQPPPLEDYNAYDRDPALREGVHREGAAWAEADLRAFGGQTGSAHVIALGFQANKYTPELKTHDRFGHRLDVVEYHPAYHELMRMGVEAQLHALPWNDARPGAHVARAAKHFMLTQVEAGVECPLTMTFAVVPSLRLQPEIAEEWIPRVTATQYDPSFRPAPDKAGCIMGMAMTEKQGGSDVRANTTQATPIGAGGPGGEYLLTGHKWFCSAPMSDAFLTLAQTGKGLSCFIVPRWLPDGARNNIFIQRLKDKLGNRSNASSEMEFENTWGRMVGEEGRGVPTIIEMVNHTRLDCVIGSSGLMRQAVHQAVHHCRHRDAFGKRLADQPLMQNVLADLVLESEAATTLMLRIARGYDESESNPEGRAFVRIATAIGKYWVCKRGPGVACEALECHGGAGYVEESIMARIYREMPLASIWEGSGNVMCLDVLRAMARQPETVPALFEELDRARGADKAYDAHVGALKKDLAGAAADPNIQAGARRLVERMALALQAAQLLQHAPTAIAETYCAARLGGQASHQYGALSPTAPFQEILARVE